MSLARGARTLTHARCGRFLLSARTERRHRSTADTVLPRWTGGTPLRNYPTHVTDGDGPLPTLKSPRNRLALPTSSIIPPVAQARDAADGTPVGYVVACDIMFLEPEQGSKSLKGRKLVRGDAIPADAFDADDIDRLIGAGSIVKVGELVDRVEPPPAFGIPPGRTYGSMAGVTMIGGTGMLADVIEVAGGDR